jgi:hypothetical protein
MKKNLLLLFAVLCTAFNINAQTNPTFVSIIGQGVGGWTNADDHDMTSVDGVNWTYTGLVVTTADAGGGIKFRANHAWTINWGNKAWPTGTGTQNGDNILCIGGTYDVTFNSTTGEYNFSGGAPIPVVKLVGTAVSDPLGQSLTTLDLATFTASNVVLLDGLGQFSIDGTTIVGGTTFPTGTVADGTQFIPIPAGKYTSISFNINTEEYSFVAAPIYNTVSIIGAGAAGWAVDTDMTTTDGINYKLDGIMLTAGEIKFRQNHNWTDPSFGDVAFPSGTATATGANILVTTPGKYSVTFNLVTGAYNFFFPTIAVVGSGAGGWPSDPQVDANALSTTDGVSYKLDGIVLTDGLAKFRQNNDWTVNWGNPAFPAGTGTQGGDNIVTVAGTYNVVFNSTTGAYDFGLPLATKGFSSSNFKVYPNPSQNNWNFTSANESIESIQILDVTGKSILTISPKNTAANVDATNLPQGLYFAKISTAKATETIKLMKN